MLVGIFTWLVAMDFCIGLYLEVCAGYPQTAQVLSVTVCGPTSKQGVSLARRFALVPLGPPLLAYKSNCKAMLKASGDFVQLEVDRAYKAGDPISVWYTCDAFLSVISLYYGTGLTISDCDSRLWWEQEI